MNREGFQNVYQQRAERRLPTFNPIEGPFLGSGPRFEWRYLVIVVVVFALVAVAKAVL